MSNSIKHLRHLTSGLDGRFRGITILSVNDHTAIFGDDIIALSSPGPDAELKSQAATLN